MRLSDRKIKEHLSRADYPAVETGNEYDKGYNELHFKETVRVSKAAFYEGEAEGGLSWIEFLYQQGRYVHKYLWMLQGAVLLVLWSMLQYLESGCYLQRCMGIGASLFAVLLLPELWKNRNSNSLEIECAACYSLRQIYSARILLCALADILMLGIFGTAAVFTGKTPVGEMAVNFFLPYLITCCICFRLLYSRKFGSEAIAVFLCMLWAFVWMEFVLNEKIYGAVSGAVWTAMIAASVFYLGYCIYKGQISCRELWNREVGAA